MRRSQASWVYQSKMQRRCEDAARRSGQMLAGAPSGRGPRQGLCGTALRADALQQHRGGVIVGVLRHQFAAEGLAKMARVRRFACLRPKKSRSSNLSAKANSFPTGLTISACSSKEGAGSSNARHCEKETLAAFPCCRSKCSMSVKDRSRRFLRCRRTRRSACVDSGGGRCQAALRRAGQEPRRTAAVSEDRCWAPVRLGCALEMRTAAQATGRAGSRSRKCRTLSSLLSLCPGFWGWNLSASSYYEICSILQRQKEIR